MKVIKKSQLTWLEFELFKPFPLLKQGTLTRHGGISSSPYDSLNFGLNHQFLNDDAHQNLEIVKKVLKFPHIAWALQEHQTHIEEITLDNIHQQFVCDGFVSREKNMALFIKHADCQAALFYDPIHQAIAAIHCGWKGNVQNIYQKLVQKMTTLYQSRPEDLLVGISPSLEPSHSEFIHYQKEFPKNFWPFEVSKNHFDLWQISQMQLIQSGIKESNIEIARIGTFDNPQDFFSYRRDKQTGRNASFICLNHHD